MRVSKKTLIAAALVSAGLSSHAEGNPPVYWPAMAMMPVRFGIQVMMIPVSGWITPRGFLPALLPQAGQYVLAGAPPVPGFLPGMLPNFSSLTPGVTLRWPQNLAFGPGLTYIMPVPGQVPSPTLPPTPPGSMPTFVPGTIFPGPGMASTFGMTFPAPMAPPLPAQAQQFLPPGFHLQSQGGNPFVSAVGGGMPATVPRGMVSGTIMGTTMEASAPTPEATTPEADRDKEPALTVPGVTDSTLVPQPKAHVSQAKATAVESGVTTGESRLSTSEPTVLRTEAALVAVPVAAAAKPTEPMLQAADPAQDPDGDGVPNDVDLCPGKPGMPASLGCPVEEGIRLGGIVFRYDSDELTEESKAILERVAQKLVRRKGIRLEVAGHTDSQGDAMYNLDLSERRARAVRAYLVEQGVSPSRLIAKGYGQTRPVADNGTREGRAMNRRVELKPV